MAKTIRIKYEGLDYTLEFTRNSIVTMERNGFNVTELQSKPMTRFSQLFAGAFLAHHKSVKQSEIDKIFAALGNKEKLLTSLVDMYNEPLSTLIEDGGNEGNAIWEED